MMENEKGAAPIAAQEQDEGYEMSTAERFAWFLNSPRHQGDRKGRVIDEFTNLSGINYIDVAESGSYIYMFEDGSALLHQDDGEAIAFKHAAICDVSA